MINLEQLGVHLPQGYLFQNITVQINKGDKIGLAGKNGAGKSTLLKLISGKDQPSEGKIHRPKDLSIGYLTQDIKIDTELSVFEFLNQSNELLTRLKNRLDEINHDLVVRTDYESDSYMEMLNELSDLNHEFNLHEGFLWEEKIASTLKGLGFSDAEFDKKIAEFSGGWKMRAELAKILVKLAAGTCRTVPPFSWARHVPPKSTATTGPSTATTTPRASAVALSWPTRRTTARANATLSFIENFMLQPLWK